MARKFPNTVKLPDGTRIQNTHECYLPIPNLPQDAVIARIFPQLQTDPLLSRGQLCDAGCNATLDKDELKTFLRGHEILKGSRNFVTKMWEVNFTPKLSDSNDTRDTSFFFPQINNIYHLSTTNSVIAYLHAAAFFPVKITWLKAIINKFIATWPFLIYTAVN